MSIAPPSAATQNAHVPAPSVVDPERRFLRDQVRWPDDQVTPYVVACHPDGLTAPQVSQVLELAVSNVHRDQASAARKLRALAHHPELGHVARAWADMVGERAAASALGAARERVLRVMQQSGRPMHSRRIRALAQVRWRYAQLVLSDAVAVGLVRAVRGPARHRLYELVTAA